MGQIEAFWLHRSPTAADRGSTQKREAEVPSETQIPGGQLHLGVCHNANGRFLQTRSIKLTDPRWEVDDFKLFALDRPKGGG